MLIQELSREECLKILAGTRLARLACVHGDQPYIVPVYLAYDMEMPDTPSLCGVTTFGTKVEWMRANPRVCVEVDDINDFDHWVSVIALGRYEELKDQTQSEGGPHAILRRPLHSDFDAKDPTAQTTRRLKAYQILQRQAVPMWWEPAETAWASRPERKTADSYVPLYYRVWIERISGHRAIPDETEVNRI